jgi:hypothetical protein
MRHCIVVIGADDTGVPSDQLGRSSMYSWTVFETVSVAMLSPHQGRRK